MIRILVQLAVILALVDSVHAAEDWVKWNKDLIDVYRTSTVRERGGTNQMPSTVLVGSQKLQAENIKIFTSMTELARASQNGSSAAEAVMHEYVRKQINWGMPWLPLSWTLDASNIENSFTEITRGMARTLDGLLPLTNDKLLIAYLFSGSIVHANNSSLVNGLRLAADELGQLDQRGFWDIRVEIHQEPSGLTLARIEDYISKTPVGSYKVYAQQIHTTLKAFLGNSDLDSFVQMYRVPTDVLTDLNNTKHYSETLLGARTQQQVQATLKGSVDTLSTLSGKAYDLLATIKAAKIENCDSGRSIDCSYEFFDLLRQYQTSAMSLAVNLHNALVAHTIEISPRDFLTTVRALVVANISIGLMDEAALKKIDQILAKNLTSASELRALIAFLEAEIGRMEPLIKGAFATELGKYSKYLPKLKDTFVADAIRATTALPLSNLMSSMYQTLQKMDGVKISINNQRTLATFRVLNPGVAKGVLRLADPVKMNEEGFQWDADAIYILEKTPAEIQKVAGILTADSGSSISHVQLLAGNHGIPNVYVSPSLVAASKKMLGKVVFLASLPNGEAIIKLATEMSDKDQIVLNEYQQFKEKQKVSLSQPSGLNVDFPLRLEQLRITDSGKVAGGKACGQGELARVFPNTVPQALILPFGVYNQHVKKTGIFEMVQKTFKDPAIMGSKEKKAKALQKIREAIRKIKFDPLIRKTITDFVSQPQFSDVGFFIRSDTNAEDLPQFVGAGLNLTVPNVRGVDNILDAVKEVWGSPFTEKAMSWREDLIRNPWEIYPSVVIQAGVSSEKAGVMVVGDPNTGDMTDKILIAGNEGVGITTVNGEYAPEEVEYSRKSKEARRLRKAYAKERRVLSPTGIQKLPSLGLDPLFSPEEIAALVKVGTKIQKHLTKKGEAPGAWDLEFGLIDGKVILFQIRPFIGNKIMRNTGALIQLQSAAGSKKEAQLTVEDRGLVLFDYKKN